MPKKSAAEFSLSVSRALNILSIFSQSRPELSLAEISRHTGLSKPSILRFMQALMMHGYVEQHPQSKRYRPGIETFRIGSLVGKWGLDAVASPIMRAVAEETGFSSYLTVMHGDKMVVQSLAEGRGPIRFRLPLGERLPLHTTSSGQAALSVFDDAAVTAMLSGSKLARRTGRAPGSVSELLDRLREVRARGYSISWEMNWPGVGSVASPAVGPNGELAGVLSIGFATGQIDKLQCRRLGAKIYAAAQGLSAALQKLPGLPGP